MNKDVKKYINEYLLEKIEFKNRRVVDVTSTLSEKHNLVFGVHKYS